jgi:hypothetical protein
MSRQYRLVSLIVLALLVLSFTFISMPDKAYAGGAIANGGFESGDFTGWNVTIPQLGTAQVVSQYKSPGTGTTYDPVEGRYFAKLTPGVTTDYTIVSQNFAADRGDVISGWAFFKSEDYMPFNDRSSVDIFLVNNMENRIVGTVFAASVSTAGNYGAVPWTSWSYAIMAKAVYSVQARIINVGDPSLPSVAGIDGIVIQSSMKPFLEGDSSPSIPTQSQATAANTKVLTAMAQPTQVIAGQPVKILANVANRGEASGTLTANLTINGTVEESRRLIIGGNTGRAVEFTVARDKPGIYTLDVNGQKAYFTVMSPDGISTGKVISYIILGVMGLAILVLGIAIIRRHLSP